MSSPTVIWHYPLKNGFVQVITFFERGEFRAVAQRYAARRLDPHKLVLAESRVWYSEKKALEAANEMVGRFLRAVRLPWFATADYRVRESLQNFEWRGIEYSDIKLREVLRYV